MKQSINIIDVNEFQNEHTMDEIKSKCFNNIDETLCITNQKYYFEDKNDFYLDIPLCEEFYRYNMQHISIATNRGNLTYTLNIPDQTLDQLPLYVYNDIRFLCEETLHHNNIITEQKFITPYDLICLQTFSENHIIFSSINNFPCSHLFTKFIFISF